MNSKTNRLIGCLMFVLCCQANAKNTMRDKALVVCISESVKKSENNRTVSDVKKECEEKVSDSVGQRVVFEKQAANNPFAILPHKPNYVLPVTYFDANEAPYVNELQGFKLDNLEAKFQVSVKYVAKDDIFFDGLDLQFAFTATSWWQSYNSEISAPFRETNYEPELIFSYKKPWSFAGIKVANSYLSFNHQSNGQAGELSRSWNRLIAGIAVTHDNFIWSFRTWWRFPEDPKKEEDGILLPIGDDNPNIEKYMGYGELGAVWKLSGGQNFDILLRNNLRSDNKGAIQLGWSYPVNKHLRGYIEYFNGYGESLIYYNHSIERIGIGVKLTDWL